jgi:hypothetical protein
MHNVASQISFIVGQSVSIMQSLTTDVSGCPPQSGSNVYDAQKLGIPWQSVAVRHPAITPPDPPVPPEPPISWPPLPPEPPLPELDELLELLEVEPPVVESQAAANVNTPRTRRSRFCRIRT